MGSQVHILVFKGFLEPLDEHAVASASAPAAAAIHADGDAIIFQHRREFQTGELATLARVEDFGRTVSMNRFLQRLDAETRRQCIRQAPSQDPPTGRVHYGKQIDGAASRGNVGPTSDVLFKHRLLKSFLDVFKLLHFLGQR